MKNPNILSKRVVLISFSRGFSVKEREFSVIERGSSVEERGFRVKEGDINPREIKLFPTS